MGDGNVKIEWQPHGHKRRSQGFVDGEPVADITKNKNHTHINTGIYSVSVLGTELKGPFRSIDEVRAAAQAEYDRRTDNRPH
jgi:hypothetical protein